MSGWFDVSELLRGVYLIAEPAHVFSYLVVGDHRALLIDSGTGLGDTKEAVADITDKEIVLLNTHYHFDHVGNNGQFGVRLIHEAGAELVTRPIPKNWWENYIHFSQVRVDRYAEYRSIDEQYFYFLSREKMVRRLPEDAVERYNVPPKPTGVVRHGDRLDLGGVVLEVLHTPGHAPDHISLLDRQRKVLFAGDVAYTAPLLVQFDDCNLDAYVDSLRMLCHLQDDIEIILPCHGTTPILNRAFLKDVLQALERVQRNACDESQMTHGEDEFGNKVTSFRFTDFTVVMPR